jgi:adenylosuccinate lyase
MSRLPVLMPGLSSGLFPGRLCPKIKLARCNIKRYEEILKETHHDMTAFLGAVADECG